MRSIAGKVSLITGASTGIGRALALELARRGARLGLAARDEARLGDVAAQCGALGAEAVVLPADVGSEDACRDLVRRTLAALGGIDFLVLNAGISMWAPFEELRDLAIFERMMRVNYLAGVYLCAEALPHLRASRGSIVGIASVAGLTGVPTRTGYAASKHAQIGFLDTLRIELLGSGVDVTIVAPDFVASEIRERAAGPDGQPLGAGHSPVQEGRVMTAEACARRIVLAMERGERLAILSVRGRLGRWLKLLAPGLIDRVARRAIARGR